MLRNLKFLMMLSILLAPLTAKSVPDLENYFPELNFHIWGFPDFPEHYYDFCEKTAVYRAEGPIVPAYRKTVVKNDFDDQGRVVSSETYLAGEDDVLKLNRRDNFFYESPTSRVLKRRDLFVVDYLNFSLTFERDVEGRIIEATSQNKDKPEETYKSTYHYNNDGQLVKISGATDVQTYRFSPGLPAKGLVTAERSIASGIERFTFNFNEEGQKDFSKYTHESNGRILFEKPVHRIFENGFLTKELADDGNPVPTVTAYKYNDSGKLHSIISETRSETAKTREVSSFKYDCHK